MLTFERDIPSADKLVMLNRCIHELSGASKVEPVYTVSKMRFAYDGIESGGIIELNDLTLKTVSASVRAEEINYQVVRK